MADNQTMAQLLQAPTEGYEDAIVIPEINANFELKHDSLNSAAGGNFLDKMSRECLRIIKSKSKVRNSRNKAVVAKNLMKTMLIDKQKAQAPATVKAVEQSCVTCRGTHSYKKCPATDGNVYQDNIQEYVSQVAAANFNQGNSNSRPPMVLNQIRPPVLIKTVEITSIKGKFTNLQRFKHQFIKLLLNKCKTLEEPSTPLVPTPVVSNPQKEPEQNPETSTEKVQNPNLENIAQVPPPEEEESIFMEIPKPKAKKTVNVETQDLNSPRPNSYQPKLLYPERMKVRENDKPNAQHSRFLKMFKQLCLEIGLKDALIEMPKFNKWLSSLLRNKEKLEEIAITTVNAECSAIIMNKVPKKLEDPRKFLILCALQELNRTSALADSGASINLLPHSIYKRLGLEALTPTRMTLELANRSITHPMGIAEDVVVRVDGFTFLADFVVVNFKPDPRVPITLGRPFLRTVKALIDLYEETLTLRVGKEELVYYADKSDKNKNKHFVHAIYVIDFSKDDPFSGSTTTYSDNPSPSSSPVKTSDNFEKFADELAPLDSLPPGNDDSTLKKDLHEENFQDHSNPLFDEMEEDVAQEDNNDEIDDFLAMEVSSNFEEGYFDSEGDVTFLDNLLSNDASHNLAFKVISDYGPEQNESSITFSPRSDPLHHEFAGELLTLPSGNDHEFEEYLSLMIVLCEISTSQSQENVRANQSSVIESLPVSPIPVEDSEPGF
ncbi:reverse transcriptase domain-containing protein [Tanacetum coccineum]